VAASPFPHRLLRRGRRFFDDPGVFVQCARSRRCIPRDYLMRYYATKRRDAVNVRVRGRTEVIYIGSIIQHLNLWPSQ
jgi:hypothetical protein